MIRDVRTLCYRCAQEMREARYVLIRTGCEVKSACDKCSRSGYDYEVVNK